MKDYLEWARLEAGLTGWDTTGEEHGETEEPAACICPDDDKELLLFSGGVLGNKGKKGTFEKQKH